MLSRYDYNEIMGIPNHSPCDVCGKINGGIMSGSLMGNGYRVCGDKCYKRLVMRLDNGLMPWNKEEEYCREDLMRFRIIHLKKQLKAANIKSKRTMFNK